MSPVTETYQSVGPALPDWEEAPPYLPDEFDNEDVADRGGNNPKHGQQRPQSLKPASYAQSSR